MKNSLKKVIALATVAVMLLCMIPVATAATPDFVIAAGNVTGELGDSYVEIPLNITKMYEDQLIGGLTVEVNYDTGVFTFEESGWTNGSMVKVPADVILNVMTPGLIRIMFSSATDPISADMVDADSLFGTVKLGIKDTTAAIDETITLTTNDDLYDDMANTLIAQDDMGASLKAGKVVIEGEEEIIPPVDPEDPEDPEVPEVPVVPEDPEDPEDTEDPEVVTIESAKRVNITVNTGLSLSTVVTKLPDTVTVTGDVEWNRGSKTGQWEVSYWEAVGGFAGTVEGEYTFEGVLASKEGFVIDTTVFATVTVVKQDTTRPGAPAVTNPVLGALISDDDEEKVGISFVIGDNKYNVNGATNYADVQIAMYNAEGDRTLVPVRFITEALGYEVGWDEATQTVTIKNSTQKITLVIGNETMTVDGKAVQMDTAPVIYNDRTYVPIRFIAENFGMEVGFDEATQQVTLSSK